jgi:hypothetical protein
MQASVVHEPHCREGAPKHQVQFEMLRRPNLNKTGIRPNKFRNCFVIYGYYG